MYSAPSAEIRGSTYTVEQASVSAISASPASRRERIVWIRCRQHWVPVTSPAWVLPSHQNAGLV